MIRSRRVTLKCEEVTCSLPPSRIAAVIHRPNTDFEGGNGRRFQQLLLRGTRSGVHISVETIQRSSAHAEPLESAYATPVPS